MTHNVNVVSLNPQDLVEWTISQVMISDVRIDDVLTDVPLLRRPFVSNKRHTAVTVAELSERWCIGFAQATNTIRITRNEEYVRQYSLLVGDIELIASLKGPYFGDSSQLTLLTANASRSMAINMHSCLLQYIPWSPNLWQAKVSASSFTSTEGRNILHSTAQRSRTGGRQSL